MLAGLPLDTLDLEEHGNLDDCNSPVKKKHKSASPKPSAHGLSEEELKRIDKLKKNELIAELDDLGGDYNKIWKKELLRDALLEAYAAHNNHAVETQVEDDERLVNKMDVIWESEENGPVDAEPRKNDEMDISLDLDEQKDKVPVAVSITISNKHPVTDGTSSYREIDSTKINSGTLGMELAPRQGAIERSFNKEEKKGVQGNNDVEAKVVDEICRSAVSLCMLDELCMPSVINSAHPKSCTKIHKVVTAVKIGEPTAVKIGEPMLADSDKLLQNKIEGISEGNKSEAQPNKSSSKHSVTYGDTTCCEDKTAKMTKEPFRDDPPSTQGMVKRAIAAKEKKVAVATARGSTEPESKNASENCTNVVSSAVSDKSEPPAANNTSMEIDEHKTTKSGMLDAPIDAHYSESQEFFSAQQSESSQLSINHTKKLAVQQYALTLTPIQGSVVKPPRSPSSVPCGLVDSIKKKLMASQTKQPLQHVHFPSIKDREEDHEKVVSKNLQHVRFPSMKDREEDNEKGVSKDGMTDVAPKVAEDPEQIGEVVSASERQLTTPMLSSALTKASSTKSKHVASDAFRATADARSLRLAQMKAKV